MYLSPHKVGALSCCWKRSLCSFGVPSLSCHWGTKTTCSFDISSWSHHWRRFDDSHYVESLPSGWMVRNCGLLPPISTDVDSWPYFDTYSFLSSFWCFMCENKDPSYNVVLKVLLRQCRPDAFSPYFSPYFIIWIQRLPSSWNCYERVLWHHQSGSEMPKRLPRV